MVEADKRADQAVVALPRGDAGVGAGDAGVDLPLLLHVRVLHDERVADLGLAPDLLTNWCRGSVKSRLLSSPPPPYKSTETRTAAPHCRMDRCTIAPSRTAVRSPNVESSVASSTSALASTTPP